MAELSEHQAPWDELLSALGSAAPMSSQQWVAAYFQHRVASNERWFCVLAYQGARLVGALPAVVTRESAPLRCLRTPRDEHTIAVEPLVLPGLEREVLPLLLRGAEREAGAARYIEIARIPDTSKTLAALQAGDGKHLTTQTKYGEGAFLPVSGAFSDYEKSLSKNFRSNLKKAKNRLARLEGVSFTVLRGADATVDDFERFARVEASSWKGDSGTAIACSEELRAFYRTLVTNLSGAGTLEWHFLDGDGTTLAANLAIRRGRRLVVWKLGYDEKYHRCSPGSLLLKHVIEAAHQDGSIDEIDLLTDHPWYDNWEMKRRAYYDVRVFAWHPVSLACGYAPSVARSQLRQSQTLRRMLSTAREWRQPHHD